MPASLVKQLSTPGGFPHFGGQDYGLSLPRAARVAGVDLNLDNFSLEEPVRVKSEIVAGSCDTGNIACEFWAALDEGGGDDDDDDASSIFKPEDKSLFKKIFRASLSDRREEGDRFIPPNPAAPYIENLRGLVAQEEQAQQQRRGHFFSREFAAEDPGQLFPLSWVSARVTQGQRQGKHLRARPDYAAQPGMFDLRSAVPRFDKATEEGLRFRAYEIGCLEVRTTQERGGEEVVGAVYTLRAPQRAAGREQIGEHDGIMKVAEYVGAAQTDAAAHFHSYTVLETVEGDAIVTGKLEDGTLTWEENPEDLEDRNSLAKCIRTWDCSRARATVTVGDVKTYKKAHVTTCGASHSNRKHYAQLVFNHVKGLESRAQSGFANKNMWSKEKEANNYRKEKLRFKKEVDRAARRAVTKVAKVDKTVTSPVVVGSWTNWEVAQAMAYDEKHAGYTLDIKMGADCAESFQILCNNDWERCLHPDRENAHAHEEHALCGPDNEGNGKNWTVGLRAEDRGAKGVRYRIVLRVGAKGLAEKVGWERLGPGVLLA